MWTNILVDEFQKWCSENICGTFLILISESIKNLFHRRNWKDCIQFNNISLDSSLYDVLLHGMIIGEIFSLKKFQWSFCLAVFSYIKLFLKTWLVSTCYLEQNIILVAATPNFLIPALLLSAFCMILNVMLPKLKKVIVLSFGSLH